MFGLINTIHSQSINQENKLNEKRLKEEEEFIKWKEEKNMNDIEEKTHEKE